MNWKSVAELDARLSRRLHIDQAGPTLRRIAVFLAHSGDSWFWLAGLGILWLVGSAHWRSLAALMAFGVVTLAGLVLAIKFLVRRRRPEGDWGAIYRNTDPHSFPSGHAARAFMLAMVASALGPLWLAVMLWVWAPLVSLARVSMRVHYMLDVVAGLVVGLLAGLVVCLLQPALATFFPFIF
jgi:undecaprenyl-diphosphatase